MLPCWYEAWDPTDPLLAEVLTAGVFLPLQAGLYSPPYSILGTEGFDVFAISSGAEKDKDSDEYRALAAGLRQKGSILLPRQTKPAVALHHAGRDMLQGLHHDVHPHHGGKHTGPDQGDVHDSGYGGHDRVSRHHDDAHVIEETGGGVPGGLPT